ncbi:hypothetical protein [Paraburkholderia aspalathi]|uniref:hypothetical protein n=1 Tax=Paraburkholderia aspalathi TaxID=1324617 RepID=UPI001909303C|nr:hypothetical protein [Paraburkholderia aspalathi]MBK3821813.1 hypothetical protein [Paraburkholderia aspalathi]MBK3833690.1 hypothetical protein [Paraburkholderia aspalathi]MBK3863370.1 hypothetical protein [Paraburkholderia aspalathi]
MDQKTETDRSASSATEDTFGDKSASIPTPAEAAKLTPSPLIFVDQAFKSNTTGKAGGLVL